MKKKIRIKKKVVINRLIYYYFQTLSVILAYGLIIKHFFQYTYRVILFTHIKQWLINEKVQYYTKKL